MSWGVATALLEQRGERGPVRGRRGVAAADRRRARPEADRARQPLPRPARPLRRARARSPTTGRRWSTTRAGRSGFVLNADDPLIADLGRDRELAPAPGRHLLRDRGPARRRCPSSSTPTTPSTAAAAATPTPTSAPSSATSATTSCPNCGADRPAPDVAATEIELRGMRGSRSRSRTPEGEARARAAPPRPLQRLQRARGAHGGAAARRRPRAGASRRSAAVEAAFGRVETIEVAGTPVSILLIKNPAGANEVLRTLRLEAARDGDDGRSTSGSRSTTGSPTAATSPGSGTPTSSCSPARRAQRRLRRHPGAGDGACGSSTPGSTRS